MDQGEKVWLALIPSQSSNRVGHYAGGKWIQSSTLEKFTTFTLNWFQFEVSKKEPAAKHVRVHKWKIHNDKDLPKLKQKSGGRVTQSYSLTVAKFKRSSRPCKLSVEKRARACATQVVCTKACLKVPHVMQRPGLKLK